ncbi:MAG TPA: response regulator transcription factor, partial [Bryobacteraceae bacterium]|nr:response regulator transcription factor [Bryobacteraceae bacterium]
MADEVALVREGVSRLCDSTEQFKVIDHCSDGETALNRIRLTQPDIAIIDLQIPKLFSLEMIRKAREEGLGTRFVVIAARGDRKTALEALRAGANAFVLKCSAATQVLDALKSVSAGSVYVSPELQFERVFFDSKANRTADPLETLSSREFQVFRLLVEGIRAKEIAARLELSPKTIDTYRASL